MKRVSARATILATILCALVTIVPAWSVASAFQGDGVTVYLEVTDWITGEPLTRACFVLKDASNEGCDENRDGLIRFRDVAPGTYNVIQTQGIRGYLPVGDFPILVNIHDGEQFFPVQIAEDSSTTETADVAVRPFDLDTNESVPGQCLIFHGGSLEGCDENGDGWVEFDDLPVGSYLLSHTQATPGYARSPDEWFGITGDGYVRVPVGAESAGDDPGTPDIALITREPKSAELLPSACYVLIEFSNEGCDEDDDGRVTFANVPAGTYQVEQTVAPADETRIDIFTIEVISEADEQGIVVKQAKVQTDDHQRHVSVLYEDPYTGDLIRDRDTCVTLVNAGYESAEACDDNRDGQVDFLDVPLGTYDIELEVADRPPGSELVYGPMTIEVTATEASAILVLSTMRIT